MTITIILFTKIFITHEFFCERQIHIECDDICANTIKITNYELHGNYCMYTVIRYAKKSSFNFTYVST